MKKPSQVDALYMEAMIDRYGLAQTLEVISQVCSDKATHIRENWQDITLALRWLKVSNEVDYLAQHSAVKAVSE